MPKFEITTSETYYSTYTVEAENLDEALEKVAEGEAGGNTPDSVNIEDYEVIASKEVTKPKEPLLQFIVGNMMGDKAKVEAYFTLFNPSDRGLTAGEVVNNIEERFVGHYDSDADYARNEYYNGIFGDDPAGMLESAIDFETLGSICTQSMESHNGYYFTI